MFADRLEEFLADEPDSHHSGVNFLAHEDVALKAYFETRPRYLGNLPARRAFNRIGEVLPTVLHDGQVIGTWAWDETGRRVTTSLVRGRTTPQIRTTAKAHADRLAQVLRQGWTSGRPARATMIPGQLALLPQQIQA